MPSGYALPMLPASQFYVPEHVPMGTAYDPVMLPMAMPVPAYGQAPVAQPWGMPWQS